MSDLETELQAVNAAILTDLVRASLEHNRVNVIDWSYVPIEWGAINPVTAGLYRFFGTAREGEQRFSWSLVLKIIRWVDFSGSPLERGYLNEPTDWNYWKREALVFRSGILNDVQGDLVPVQCYDVVEQTDGSIWLWLEDLTDSYDSQWDIGRHVLAARHFGEFNGSFLARLPIPANLWLCKQFLRQWVSTGVALGENKSLGSRKIWDHPLMRLTFPIPVAERISKLVEDSDSLLKVLNQQPQTLSHLDSQRSNLFARRDIDGRDQTVVIDWSFLGLAAAGEDLGMQVSGNLFNLELDPLTAHNYQEAALEAYLGGLETADWQGNRESVRFAYATAASLRYVPFGAYMLTSVVERSEDSSWINNLAEKHSLTVEEVLQNLGMVLYFLLDLADEARGLASRVTLTNQ